jgi:hypothetical protein
VLWLRKEAPPDVSLGPVRRAAIGVLLTACLGSLGACADSENPSAPGAERATRAYLRAVFDNDDATACAQLGKQAQADLVDYASIDAPEAPHVSNCPQALTFLTTYGSLDLAAAGVMDHDAVTADAAAAPIETVRAGGDSAVLRVAHSDKTVALSQASGRWTIDALDFSDVPGR